MQDWVFGCDICQDVCPVNLKAAPTKEPSFQKSDSAFLDLLWILEMTEEEFRDRFRYSPIKRAKRVGLQRNACIALGNIGDERAVSPLAHTLLTGEPLVRGHAAWALGRIGGSPAHSALRSAIRTEKDPAVVEEIPVCFGELGTTSS